MCRLILPLFLLLIALPLQAAKQQLTAVQYKQLMQVQKLIEEDQVSAALNQLNGMKQKYKKPYPRALVLQNIGMLEVRRERYKSALNVLEEAYSLKALSDEQQLQLLHTLAQLNMNADNWAKGAELMQRWLKQAPSGKPKASDYLMLAQAYGQLKKWRSVINPVKTAIRMKGRAPESWYQLRLAAHMRLKQWKSAIAVQKTVVSIYGKKAAHWRQLADLQLQNRQSKSALATLRMAYERGLIKDGSTIRKLAQLMLQHDLPVKSAEVLGLAMKQKRLKRSARNLTLLSQAWLKAREMDDAITSLASVVAQKPTLKNLKQLAKIQLQEKQWREAQQTLQKALAQKPEKPAELLLLQGIARVNMAQFNAAKSSFQSAASEQNYQKVAESWIRYLEQVEQKG